MGRAVWLHRPTVSVSERRNWKLQSSFAVTGTKGEGMLMAVAERKLVVEAWVKAANEK